MALSQIHCLDDHHVNPRTHEAKAEFLYCENQRLALEALLRDGRDAFAKCLQERGLRGFLSDPELETLAGAAQRYDPDSELRPPVDAEDGEPPLSLHYWPELSDTSVPEMDLGWPDSDAYRGVTRASVYTQPPLDGQTHVKEIVRKMIAQAQKVIAVVMDVFTDVDIFRDLLDAGFKRRVSVYILLERTRLPHFLSMCQRANMHAGQLKNLRVRCTQGTEFCTRSCTRVRGQLGHRFMFVDGDKAVSGSYSFTWMSSRLDRNLITVVTGQAVDAFDRLFRFLYATSSSVDLRQFATEPTPEPEILPKPAVVAPPSAADARKLYNPKYALVASAAPGLIPSTAKNNSKEPQNSENSKEPEVPGGKKRKRRRGSKDAEQDAFPLHPGLANLEKACLIAYLPTWPEPDPPSDVIGFINIRDAKKPTQVHLQRSEMFETSQAIRFSSPINVPQEILPEVAKPKQSPEKHKEVNKVQPGQNKSEAEKSVVDGGQSLQLSAEPGDVQMKGEAPERISSTSEQKVEPSKDITKSISTEGEMHLKSPANQDEDLSGTSNHTAHKPPQSNSNTSTPKAVNTNSPKPQVLPRPYPDKEAETDVNKQSVVNRTHTMDSSGPADPNSAHTKTKAGVLQTDVQVEAVNTQPHIVETPNTQTPTVHSSISTSQCRSEEPSEENHLVLTSVCTSGPSASCSSSVPPLSASTLDPPLLSSPAASPLTPSTPIPKPRTVQLVIKDGGAHDDQNLPEISVVRRNENLASDEQPAVNSKSDVMQVPPENKSETVPQLESSSAKATGAQTDTESVENPKEAPEPKQNGPSRMEKDDETNELDDDVSSKQSAAESKPQVQTDVLPTDAPKVLSGNIQEVIPKELEPLSLTLSDCNLLPKTEPDNATTAQADIKAPEKHTTGSEFTEEPHEMSENVIPIKTYVASAHEPQRISRCEVTPAVLDEESLKSSVSATTNSHISKDSQQNHPTVTPAHHTDSKPPIAKRRKNPKSKQTPKASGSSHTPERPSRLHLSETHSPNLHPPTDERGSRPPTPLVRTPTLVLPSTPTSDSRTQTPDPQQHTPHCRTPTPDVSDGYISTREDSPFSTTSEEYFECSDSPFHDLVFDRAGFHSHRATVDHDHFTHMNTRNSKTITNTDSPVHINSTASDAKDRNSFSCLSTGESSGTSEEIESQEDEIGLKPNVAKRRKGRDSQEAESRGGDKSKTKTVDNPKPAKESTEVIRKDKEAKPQTPTRKRPQSLILGGVNQAEPSSQTTDTDNPGKMVYEAAQRASVDRTDVSLSPRDAEGQRLQLSPCRPPVSATRCGGGLKKVEVSHNMKSLLPPWGSEMESRARLRPNQQCYSISPVPALRTHTNIQSQSQDHQGVSVREAHRQEDRGAPFAFTFRRLYNLKELKDQMKQRRRGSTGSSAQGRKSTS